MIRIRNWLTIFLAFVIASHTMVNAQGNSCKRKKLFINYQTAATNNRETITVRRIWRGYSEGYFVEVYVNGVYKTTISEGAIRQGLSIYSTGELVTTYNAWKREYESTYVFSHYLIYCPPWNI